VSASRRCLNARSIFNQCNIVGISYTTPVDTPPYQLTHPFVRLNGGEMQDLNDLISPDSGAVLTFTWRINNAGQILGNGYFPGGRRGSCVLTPYTQIPPPFHDNFISDRYGLVGGTGWVFRAPGGRPVPINRMNCGTSSLVSSGRKVSR
jgi:hypothetical protein